MSAGSLDSLVHRLDIADKTCLAVIETPQGERCKFAWDPSLGAFVLEWAMPAGLTFPLNFGFVPSTKAGDGDPLDIMVLNDAPIPIGVAAQVRLIGMIAAEQTENGRRVRNDRLLGVACHSIQFAALNDLDALGAALIRTLTDFWTTYERLRGKSFSILGLRNAEDAAQSILTHSVPEPAKTRRSSAATERKGVRSGMKSTRDTHNEDAANLGARR